MLHSQPSVSGDFDPLQSVRPELHWYEHVEPLQLAAPVFELHVTPQPPQLVVDVLDDSHPFTSWFDVSQLSWPGWHPVYVQLPPLHAAPMVVCVSHARPQAPQFVVVVILVSQPFWSGGVELQSA